MKIQHIIEHATKGRDINFNSLKNVLRKTDPEDLRFVCAKIMKSTYEHNLFQRIGVLHLLAQYPYEESSFVADEFFRKVAEDLSTKNTKTNLSLSAKLATSGWVGFFRKCLNDVFSAKVDEQLDTLASVFLCDVYLNLSSENDIQTKTPRVFFSGDGFKISADSMSVFAEYEHPQHRAVEFRSANSAPRTFDGFEPEKAEFLFEQELESGKVLSFYTYEESIVLSWTESWTQLGTIGRNGREEVDFFPFTVGGKTVKVSLGNDHKTFTINEAGCTVKAEAEKFFESARISGFVPIIRAILCNAAKTAVNRGYLESGAPLCVAFVGTADRKNVYSLTVGNSTAYAVVDKLHARGSVVKSLTQFPYELRKY